MPKQQQVRQVRILVYEGSKSFVDTTVNNPRRAVVQDKFISHIIPARVNWHDVLDELPSDGEIVLVAGGTASFRNGKWWTGMEEPLYKRPITWPVEWWAPLPSPPTGACDSVIREAILPLPADDHANLNQQVLAVFDQLRGERSAEAVQPIHDQEVGEAEEALRVEAEWLENQQPYDGSELGDLAR